MPVAAKAVRLRTAPGLRDAPASHKRARLGLVGEGTRDVVNACFRAQFDRARQKVKNPPQKAEISRSSPFRIVRPRASPPEPEAGRETGTTQSFKIAPLGCRIGMVPA